MDGINLSQSVQENASVAGKRAILDKSMAVAFMFLVLISALWGGLWWYAGSLSGKISDVSGALADKMVVLSGKEAGRANDFFDRSIILRKELARGTDPVMALSQAEAAVIPGVILSGYQYDADKMEVMLSGKTDTFKYVAQQMLALRLSPSFSDPRVTALDRSKEGKINFLITASVHASAAGAAQ